MSYTQDDNAKYSDVLKVWMVDDEQELVGCACYVAANIDPFSVLLMDGAMGSGKTTMVRYLMDALKGEEASSPTFSLVNEYRYPDGVVYHFDLYRLENADELIEVGFEEYLDREALCIIEWPQMGTYFYQDRNVTTMHIQILDDGRRKIEWIKGIA